VKNAQKKYVMAARTGCHQHPARRRAKKQNEKHEQRVANELNVKDTHVKIPTPAKDLQNDFVRGYV
jgi:hypothetical protein